MGAWDVGAAPSPVPVSGVVPPESLVGMAGPTLYCLVERQPVIGTGRPWCTPHYFSHIVCGPWSSTGPPPRPGCRGEKGGLVSALGLGEDTHKYSFVLLALAGVILFAYCFQRVHAALSATQHFGLVSGV